MRRRNTVGKQITSEFPLKMRAIPTGYSPRQVGQSVEREATLASYMHACVHALPAHNLLTF